MSFVSTFIDNSEHYPSLIEKGEQYAVQFNALVPFDAYHYICPRMSAHNGILHLSLYKWNRTYNETVSGEAIATTVCDLADGTTMQFNFDEQQPGEYLLVAHDGTRGVGFCGLIDSFDGALIYINGTPADGSIEGYIHFTQDAEAYFGELSIDYEAIKPVKPMPKQMLSINHPINALMVDNESFTAIDGLGRKLPTYDEVGDKRKNKSVGLFYWDWHYHYELSKPCNVSKIIAEHPDAKNDYNHPIWADNQAEAYFWNEPVYGYYTSNDKYVLRRQAELLADAGVDFIVFDCTNGSYTWKVGYETLLETFHEARMDGIKTPQVAFMFNFAPFRSTHVMLRKVYTDIYRRGRYKDLWYYYDGKPLVIGFDDIFKTGRKLDNEILDFFTFRRNDPLYFTKESPTPDSWGWLSLNPQAKYAPREDGTFEQMTVGVAHNASEHGLVPMNDIRGGVYGRSHTTDPDYSYTYKRAGEDFTVKAGIENDHYYGLNFQEQFDYAIASDPDVLFITGYNEWVAGRHPVWQDSPNAFPDQYSDEFSRDVEPTKGPLKDFYYYQMAANIRRFKGLTKPQAHAAEKSIDINDINTWEDVPAVNLYLNTAPKRDNDGWAGTHYINDTARNNVAVTKCAYDSENVYFYAKCMADITVPEADNWMRLYIATDDTKPNWEGFNYYVSCFERKLKVSKGGWSFEDVADIDINLTGDTLVVKIPKSALGQDKLNFSFKWSDNAQTDGDIMDFYVNGNVAPCGRYAIPVKE